MWTQGILAHTCRIPVDFARKLKQCWNKRKDAFWLQTAAGSVLGRMVIAICKKRGVKTINVVRRSEAKQELLDLGCASGLHLLPLHWWNNPVQHHPSWGCEQVLTDTASLWALLLRNILFQATCQTCTTLCEAAGLMWSLPPTRRTLWRSQRRSQVPFRRNRLDLPT